MTNTYPDGAPMDLKLYEEIRCLRCVNERILRALDEGLFVDYQLEKFGKAKVNAHPKTYPPMTERSEGELKTGKYFTERM